MEIIDHSKSVLENIYYLSGVIIAILGFAVIIQLKLTKKAIITSSQRQAAELAGKQVEIYSNVIKDQDEIFLYENEKKIEPKKIIGLKKFDENELEKIIGKKALIDNKLFLLENLDYTKMISNSLNSMEAFATYFASGIANEEIAFSALGSSFCFSVEKYSLIICVSRNDKDDLTYNNIVKLYDIWNSRIKSQKIINDLEKNKVELLKLKKEKIDILGTK